jgi:hypothetical protein
MSLEPIECRTLCILPRRGDAMGSCLVHSGKVWRGGVRFPYSSFDGKLFRP